MFATSPDPGSVVLTQLSTGADWAGVWVVTHALHKLYSIQQLRATSKVQKSKAVDEHVHSGPHCVCLQYSYLEYLEACTHQSPLSPRSE